MFTHLRLVCYCLLLCAPAMAHAGGTADSSQQRSAGRIKADQVCANCHGLDGQAAGGGNSALSPSLTAQSRGYLIAKLNAYRSGKIQHPQMTLIARMISEQDIENVAYWYSNLEISIADSADEQTAGASKNATTDATSEQIRQTCSHCHGMNGQAVAATSPENTPHLTGQQKGYLIARLQDYRSGKIQHPLMSPIAQNLSDTEILALAEWYSRFQIKIENLD